MSKRGTNLHVTREEAVLRALSQLIALPKAPKGEPHPIGYRLEGGFNGGSDPAASHCASWSYGDRVPTADCIGFVLWASGIDRLQPGYKGTAGEWLHCGSLLADAHGAKRFCRTLQGGEAPLPGDWLLTDEHIGMIVRASWTDISGALKPKQMPLMVIDCSPRHDPHRVDAIKLGGPWSSKCEVVRPLFYGPMSDEGVLVSVPAVDTPIEELAKAA